MKFFNLKRILPFIISAVLLVVCIGIFTVSATTSEPAVIYDGRLKQINFENAFAFGNNDNPDLFPNFKDMMPGDSISQKITVGAKNIRNDHVNIRLKAESENDDYIKLIETYGHWVKLSIYRNGAVFLGNLKQGVSLGSFTDNHKYDFSVKLSIDPNAGNELQNLVAQVDWVFVADHFPGGVITPEPTPPITPAPDVDPSDLPWLISNKHINYLIGYTDGFVRPNGAITRAEVATIFYRLLTDEVRERIWSTESKYPDVKADEWFYMAVCTLTNGGILEGYPDGTFRPNQHITRAELATIITRFDTKFGELEITESFPDTNGHWAEPYIEFAATRKYVIGYPDGTFRPGQDITRAETVTMVNRCLKRAVDAEGLIDGHLSWPDNTVGAWYYYDILEAANYHSYDRSDRPIAEQSYLYENWTYLHELIDWAKVEREWILLFVGE